MPTSATARCALSWFHKICALARGQECQFANGYLRENFSTATIVSSGLKQCSSSLAQRHLKQEAGYQAPCYSEAQLAQYARLNVRLLAGHAARFVAEENREVSVDLHHAGLCAEAAVRQR